MHRVSPNAHCEMRVSRDDEIEVPSLAEAFQALRDKPPICGTKMSIDNAAADWQLLYDWYWVVNTIWIGQE
ncbi:MAG: hypothetical protein AAF642_09845 [Pseudomonadota bacterium]